MKLSILLSSCLRLLLLPDYQRIKRTHPLIHSAEIQGRKAPVNLGAALYSQCWLNSVGQSQSLLPPVHGSIPVFTGFFYGKPKRPEIIFIFFLRIIHHLCTFYCSCCNSDRYRKTYCIVVQFLLCVSKIKLCCRNGNKKTVIWQYTFLASKSHKSFQTTV